MSAIKDSTYSTTTGELLKVTLPTFTNLTWIHDSVTVGHDGDWEKTGTCGDKNWTFEEGRLTISGEVRIAAAGKAPATGGFLADSDSKNWRVVSSEITEVFACKPCKATVTFEWDEDFHDAVAAGDYSITAMTTPPLDAAFLAAT